MKSSKKIEVIEFDNDAIKEREEAVKNETDEQIIERLSSQFKTLELMTEAVSSGDLRGMIVSGPPGVGKSFGVEEVLEKENIFNRIAGEEVNYQIVKGTLSSVGLYMKLFEFSDENKVIVFDDADTIFYDMLSLNLLKAALDTSSRRYISWNTDSRLLRSEGIPDRFEFKGSVIFITNIKFSHVRSKTLKEHLAALESRCFYIDLGIDTTREKLLRIKQIVNEGMLDKYKFEDEVRDEVVEFVVDNKDRMRELSLRAVLKVADLRKAFPLTWKEMATMTCLTRT